MSSSVNDIVDVKPSINNESITHPVKRKRKFIMCDMQGNQMLIVIAETRKKH